jgi:hypothetical protein
VGSMKPSFAAVVGSLDKYVRKHTAILRAQNPRLEVISDLQASGRRLVMMMMVMMMVVITMMSMRRRMR